MSVPKHDIQKPLVCSGHSRPVPFVAYSKWNESDDSFFAISACLDGKAMLRIGKTGDWIGTFLGHKGAVWGVDINDDATLAITGSADYTAKIWDATTGDEKHSFEHKRIVKTVGFSPDATKIVTGGQESLIRIYDINKPENEPSILKGHEGVIRRVLWHSEHSLLSAGADGIVRLWDLRTPEKPVHSTNLGADVRDLSLSAGQSPGDASKTHRPTLVCAAGNDISFVSLSELKLKQKHKLSFQPTTVAFNEQCNRFVTAGGNFSAKVFDADSGKALEAHKGHHGPVHCARFAPDLKTYATASEDGTIRLWQTEICDYGLWVVNPAQRVS